MKKALLTLAVILTATLNSNAADTYDYDSGILGNAVSFEAPAWMTVKKSGSEAPAALYKKTGLDKSKTVGDFATALGIVSGAEEANAIAIARTDPSGDATNSMILTLPSCTSVSVEFWGTGGRGLMITSSNSKSAGPNGVDSYKVGSTQLTVSSTEAVTITISPTAKNGDPSTGDVYINKIIVTGIKNPAGIGETVADKGTIVDEVFYTLLGAKVSSSNLEAGQIYLVTTTYDNGLVETTKILK